MSTQHTDAYNHVWDVCCDPPPIPIRSHDWRATRDTYDGAPDSSTRHDVVYGATEAEVIAEIEAFAEQDAQDTREETEYRVRMAGKPMSIRDM